MANIKEFGAPKLLQQIENTIGTLRQMRFAGSAYREGDQGIVTPQNTLADAKVLAEASAHYLVDYLFENAACGSDGEWIEALEDLAAKYQFFSMRYSGQQTVREAASRIIRKVTNRYPGSKEYNCIEASLYLDRNHVNGLQVPDFTRGVGIMSPLSTDYLDACCFSRYIQNEFAQGSPPVQPVLLDANKREIEDVLKPELGSLARIVVLLDVVPKHSQTMWNMDMIAKRLYPQQYTPQCPV